MNAVRTTDVVARLGGDEFIVLTYDVEPDAVSTVLNRIEMATEASNLARRDQAGSNWTLGMSLGVAYFDPQTPRGVEALLQVADAAQYLEKARRKALRRATPVSARIPSNGSVTATVADQ